MASANADAIDPDKSKQVFNLDQVTGSVCLTKEISLEPFEDVTISGLLKGPIKCSAYNKRVNVAIEPLDEHKEGEGSFCAVPSYTFLKPGSQRVQVMIKNITARLITIKQGGKVARIEAANVVPQMLAPKIVEESVSALSKSVQLGTESEEKSQETEVDQTKLNFNEETKDWSPQQKDKAKQVLRKYSFLFAMNSTDLGKTHLVKHHIELRDYTPIKGRYRRIPPHQYEEVRKHLKEMLEIGAIRRSNSPWASPV